MNFIYFFNNLQGIQSVESFLWALEKVNKDPRILPGIKLGAVIFDSCGSKEKMVRDVTNLLTDHVPEVIRDKVIYYHILF